MKGSLGHKDCSLWVSPGGVLGSEPTDLGYMRPSETPAGAAKGVIMSLLLQLQAVQLTSSPSGKEREE